MRRTESQSTASTPNDEIDSLESSPDGSEMTQGIMEMELASSPAPKSRKRKAKKSRPTRLRVDRPVKTEIHIDAWSVILKRCNPKLVVAMSGMNWNFHALLHENSCIWRESRLNTFGPECPPLPTGMTEKRYADLLEGYGCHKCRMSNFESTRSILCS